MLCLKNKFISVRHNGAASYGGSQTFSENGAMRRCGCGAVSSADLILYLARYHDDCRIDSLPPELLADVIDERVYDDFSLRLIKKYMPIIPPFGMNGLTLVLGLELFFLRHGIPLRASWGVRRDRLWERISEMLSADIPVILSIGPNFPRVWEKSKASLYKKGTAGELFPACTVNAHFLTVTGMDDDWLQVSSWGKQFYISRKEYEQYVTAHSNGLLCSIVVLIPIH